MPVLPSDHTYLQTNVVENPGLKKYIGALAKRRLRFVWGNDGAIEKEDIEAELMLKACEAARKCEAKGISGRHCTNTLRVAVTNHSLNLATRYGTQARNPLTRVHKASKQRFAWWACIPDNKVIKVVVSTLPKHRKGCYILTRNCESNQQQYCHVLRLYDDELEALRGLQRYQSKGAGKREAALDLTVDHDDFAPTLKSLDVPTQNETKAKTLYDYLGTAEIKTSEIDLTQIKNKNVRECVAIMLGRHSDALFCTWMQQQGQDVSTVTYKELLRSAMAYCRVNQEHLQAALKKFS
jgi:hypothetical protein